MLAFGQKWYPVCFHFQGVLTCKLYYEVKCNWGCIWFWEHKIKCFIFSSIWKKMNPLFPQFFDIMWLVVFFLTQGWVLWSHIQWWDFPDVGKGFAYHAGDPGSIPGLGESHGGGHSNPLQYSCLENPHGQRSLVGYSPGGHKESDTTEWQAQAGEYPVVTGEVDFQLG